MNCAAEIIEQCKEVDANFDYLIHCVGGNSTQAGLLAGFAVMGGKIRVVEIADDDETQIKTRRVHQLANTIL